MRAQVEKKMVWDNNNNQSYNNEWNNENQQK